MKSKTITAITIAILSNSAYAADEIDSKSFLGNFSVGLAVFKHKEADIKKADVINGVVRILDENETRPGLWLQTSYIFDGWGTKWSHPGLFVGVEVLEESELIKSFGMGVHCTFRRSNNGSPSTDSAFNIGLGVYVSKISVLSDGLIANSSLPTSYESAILKEKTAYGPMLNVSFSFQ